jgi:hypothetical protein
MSNSSKPNSFQQDIQCFVETTIQKLNTELSIFGTENVYVPPVVSQPINFSVSNPLPISLLQNFEIQYSIPIIMELSSTNTNLNDYYSTVDKQVIQKAFDDVNSYIRTLNINIRGSESSIFFSPQYYDINTRTETTDESKVLGILNNLVTDKSSNTKILNIIVGLNRNEQLTDNVKQFLQQHQLLLLSPGSDSSSLNQTSGTTSLNDNIFRSAISNEVQVDLFLNYITVASIPSVILPSILNNLIVLYIDNTYGNILFNKIKNNLPSNINLFAKAYSVDLTTGSVVSPSNILDTIIKTITSKDKTGFYFIGQQSSHLTDFINVANDINSSTFKLLQEFTNVKWFGTDLTYNSTTNYNVTWFISVPPSPTYSPPVDLSNFNSNILYFVGNNSDLPNTQNFFNQLFYAHQREWAEETILFDQSIIQNTSASVQSILPFAFDSPNVHRLPMYVYGLYDMIFLSILTYVNSVKPNVNVEPQVQDLINSLKLEGNLYTGLKGWYRFNSNGSLPESYYAIKNSNSNSIQYVHTIPEFKIINNIQKIYNQI